MVELNLKAWLSSGLVLAGESLSDLRQWDCLSFGEQRCGCTRCPVQAAPAAGAGRLAAVMPHLALERGTYQDDGTDVGRQQDVVPQWAPIALWLHVGGTFVVELERAGGRAVRQGTPGRLSALVPLGWLCGVHPGPPVPGYSR